MINNIKIRNKIRFMAVAALIFLLINGTVGYNNLNKSNKAIKSMYEDKLLSIKYLNDSLTQAKAIEADTYYIILYSGRNSNKQSEKM